MSFKFLVGVNELHRASPAAVVSNSRFLSEDATTASSILTNTFSSPSVTNLLPAEGNSLCAKDGLTNANQYGANVNFNLCIQSGVPAAFFGNDDTSLAVGTTTQVSCSDCSGSIEY